ncbi:MAG: hypothetical protein NTZ18_01630 [Candidatus Komeilibacteria bacterium]|nr:hypothetical protein [Candidatus Komeilibacteria bacterium]
MQENWGIIGHEEIVNFLEQSLYKNRLAGTYLFHGLPHLGKTAVAEKFAEKLLGSAWPTTELYKLEILEDKKDIGIEQVREWRRSLGFKAFTDQYKVGIIYGAEKLNRESGNALLKTIEEPSPKTVLILIVSDSQTLLPTIISRCQTIKFLPVAQNTLHRGLLAKAELDKKKLNLIESLAQGRPGLAIQLAKNEDFFNEYVQGEDLAVKVLGSPLATRWQLLDGLLEPLEEARAKVQAALNFLAHLENVLRSNLLAHYSSAPASVRPALNPGGLIKLFSLINLSRRSLAGNVQPRLVLENLIINI